MGTLKRRRGRSETIDRADLKAKFQAYIAENEIPIVSEFCTLYGIGRSTLYEIEEVQEEIDRCVTKKEANIERGALKGELNPAMSIFSLKQLGWKDRKEVEHSQDPNNPITMTPEERRAEIERLIGSIK